MFDRIVTVVDHDPILLTELDRATRPYRSAIDRETDETKREEARLRVFRETLDRLIEQRLVEHAAAKKGVQTTDAEIEQGLDAIAKQNNMSRAAILEEVARMGMTEKEYRADIAYQILEGRMVSLLLEAKLDPSDPTAAQEKLARLRKNWIAKLRAATFIEVRM